ncbi:class I SAM-dependent methyltransferase [Planctomicrobium sp. SH664]|uniref:class I SAM-dependent methyltransferase n=1 Tax=Planctomicrobium sp. SH664 TaxID=3448125 RepID=UPI003F5B4E87
MTLHLVALIRKLGGLCGVSIHRHWPVVRALPRPHRTSPTVFAALSQELKAKNLWKTEPQPARPVSELYQLWRETPNGHKWRHYFEIYEDVLRPFRDRPIRFLEIGIYQGASLALWRRFLHPESIIVGIDIDPECRRFEDPLQRIYCRIGDQSDAELLMSVVDEFGPFDVIFDDGSHVCSHMIASFNTLFLHGLAESGRYVVEDTHANYWPSHRDQSYSFLDFAKDLVDIMHQHYLEADGERQFRIGGPSKKQEFHVPLVTTQLSEIRFLDSVVVFNKQQRSVPASEHL